MLWIVDLNRQSLDRVIPGIKVREMEALLGRLLDLLGNPFGVSFLYFPFLRKDFGSLSPWGSFIRKRERIDRLIYDEIADRHAHPDGARSDILSLLMSARTQEGEPLTDNELRDELITLLAAGHETTATALTWAFYWIHKFPEVRERLLAEFCNPDSADHGAIARLPYLHAVCSETLRIYPVGMLTFPRRTTSKVDVMGYVLEPGTVVIGSIYLTHRRKEIYPDPEKFRPERFLDRRAPVSSRLLPRCLAACVACGAILSLGARDGKSLLGRSVWRDPWLDRWMAYASSI